MSLLVSPIETSAVGWVFSTTVERPNTIESPEPNWSCSLRAYVRTECEAYLRCRVLDQGFLRVFCEQCHAEWLLGKSV